MYGLIFSYCLIFIADLFRIARITRDVYLILLFSSQKEAETNTTIDKIKGAV
jgi:hypothetical protein